MASIHPVESGDFRLLPRIRLLSGNDSKIESLSFEEEEEIIFVVMLFRIPSNIVASTLTSPTYLSSFFPLPSPFLRRATLSTEPKARSDSSDEIFKEFQGLKTD